MPRVTPNRATLSPVQAEEVLDASAGGVEVASGDTRVGKEVGTGDSPLLGALSRSHNTPAATKTTISASAIHRPERRN